MKKHLLYLSSFILAFCFSLNISAQSTAGTMTFVVTTSSTGGYSPKHGLIIWLENSSGTFIKTKLKQTSNGNLDHFTTWTAKSSSNVVDATTGATLTTHGTRTVIWNGTNVSGIVVPDGTYKIWVEYAWASNMTSGKMVTSFSWTKGTSAVHLTPANFTSGTTGNLTNMTIDWVPVTTSVEPVIENYGISVYPNPSNGIINVDFNQATSIKVENILGSVVYEENIDEATAGTKSIDLSNFTNGIYFVNVMNGEKSSKYKVFLTK